MQDDQLVDPTMLAMEQNGDLVADVSSVSVDAAGNVVITCMHAPSGLIVSGVILTDTILASFGPQACRHVSIHVTEP